MPRLQVCAEAGCRRLLPEADARDARCPEHAAAYRRRTNQRRQEQARGTARYALYHSSAWRRLRPRILERDDYRCTYCGKGQAELPPRHRLTVAHIVTPEDGGAPLDPDNLHTACPTCHARADARRRARR